MIISKYIDKNSNQSLNREKHLPNYSKKLHIMDACLQHMKTNDISSKFDETIPNI